MTSEEYRADRILGRISRKLWRDSNPGQKLDDCPEDQIATVESLASWRWSEEAEREARDSLTQLVGHLTMWTMPQWSSRPQIRHRENGEFVDLVPVRGDFSRPVEKIQAMIFVQQDEQRDQHSIVGFATISDLFDLWRRDKKAGRFNDEFPLTPLVSAWQQRPRVVRPELERRHRLFPRLLGESSSKAKERLSGRLFAESSREPGQLVLFPELEKPTLAPAFLLALWEAAGGPANRAGPAALELRIFVEAILATPIEKRSIDRPLAMDITLRNLLKQLYPPPGRRPRPNEYWPKLDRAFEVLDRTRIPWEDPKTGRGGLRRVVSVSDIPRGALKLDDQLRLVVDLPPGSDVGPMVSSNLGRWGVKSAAAYRALLNLPFQWFIPGKTRRPVRYGKHWVQINDPRRYDHLQITDNLLVDLFYPFSATKQKKILVHRARKMLAELKESGELRTIEGRILPPVQ